MELQKKEDKLQTFDNENVIKNIVSRQDIEGNIFKLKSISNNQLRKISSDMDEIHEVSNVFGRRSSAFSRINLTLNHITPYQNLKQCVAEIENRRLALKDNVFKLKENLIKVKILELEIERSNCNFNDGLGGFNAPKFGIIDNTEKIAAQNELKQIEIEKLQASIIDIRLYIEGALKEIAIFQQAYNEICESFNIKDWDENDFEEAEAEYQIKRCFQQCVRNINEFGRIRSDNQEWLESLGISVANIINDIIRIAKYDNTNKRQLGHYNDVIDLIHALYIKYKDHYKERLKQKGIKNTYNNQVIYCRDSNK
jgi:hypothetical protein